ncbi:MAG: T9SS type A sorting domain-containing protein, partial [Sphingobacteriales bacterium]|nr:T9SS type A sorting domain-containing protein [Sphingobacteriales bacterium]
ETTAVSYVDMADAKIFEAKIGPNPSENRFNLQVQSSSGEPIHVTVVDISGRLISQFVTTPYQTMNFGADIKKGVYMVHILQGNDRKTLKVIKL